MKIKTTHLSLVILLSFIIILIIYLLYVNKIPIQSVSQTREGFVSRFYRPYYRILKRGLSGYFNYFLNY